MIRAARNHSCLSCFESAVVGIFCLSIRLYSALRNTPNLFGCSCIHQVIYNLKKKEKKVKCMCFKARWSKMSLLSDFAPSQGWCSSSWPACSPATETMVLRRLHCKRFLIFHSHHLLLFSSAVCLTPPSLFLSPALFPSAAQIQHATAVRKPRRLRVGSGRPGRCHHRGQWYQRYWFISVLASFVSFLTLPFSCNLSFILKLKIYFHISCSSFDTHIVLCRHGLQLPLFYCLHPSFFPTLTLFLLPLTCSC